MSSDVKFSPPMLEALRSPSEGGASFKGKPGYRLAALLRLERRELWVVVVYSIGVGLLTLVGPVAIQVLVNIIAFESLLQPLVILTIFVLVALGFAAALKAFRVWTVEIIQRRFFVRVATDFGQRLVRVRAEAFERFNGPELVNRFFDVVTVQKSAADLLMNGVSLVMQTTVGMLLLAVYHPYLLVYDLILLAVMLWVVLGVGKGAIRSAIKESQGKYDIAAWLEEIAAHVPALKSTSGVGYSMSRVNELVKEYLSHRRAHFSVVMQQIASSLVVQALSISLLLGIGGLLVMRGQLTLGQLVASEVVITMVVSAFSEFSKKLETLYDLLAALDKLGQVIDLPLERAGSRTPGRRSGPASVEASDVSVVPSGGEPALDRVSLRIEAGERVAVTGPAGEGRTALAKVLAGLRNPEAGIVRVDDLDARDSAPVAFRETVAFASGPDVFSDTVERNVSLDRPTVGIEQVHEALDQVGLLGTVLGLPDGLQTTLSNGAPLTREQAERLVLARTIAGRPRVIIVNQLLDRIGDASAFERVCDRLFAPEAPWTLVCMTNDPEVIARCGRSVRLDHGSLHETDGPEGRLRAEADGSLPRPAAASIPRTD